MNKLLANPMEVNIATEDLTVDAVGARSGLMSELTSYLANLGLSDGHLANVVSLLQATHDESPIQSENEQEELTTEEPQSSPTSTGSRSKANHR